MQLFFNFNRSCFFVVYFGKIEILVVRETRIALEKGRPGKLLFPAGESGSFVMAWLLRLRLV